MAQQPKQDLFRKPLPEGVIEVKGISARGGIVELKDGSLMLAQGDEFRLSTDCGKTWGAPRTLAAKTGAGGMIRLSSGALAIYGSNDEGTFFCSSQDEGKTWCVPTVVCPHWLGRPMMHSMIQLRSGRLLLTMYWEGLDGWEYDGTTMVSVHPELQYKDVSAYGLWRGQRMQIEGHAHGPEMGISTVHRSDDEGRTWTKHLGGLMGWFDFQGIPNGYCGQTGCFEPTIVQTKTNEVLFVARSTVGRLVQSFSSDEGEHWQAVLPNDMPSSESPALMVSLPETNDLLIVWNQVSHEEIRRGYRRGRLSSAISTDGGHSWRHFKTLEVSEGLEDSERILPEFPIQMVRARQWVGPIPDGWAFFHYANLDVVAGHVVVRYSRGTPLLGVAEQKLNKQEAVLRVYPIEWFYE